MSPPKALLCQIRVIKNTGVTRLVYSPSSSALNGPANFIDDGQRLWIIDWEVAGRGDRFLDLGCFAANCELDEAQ